MKIPVTIVTGALGSGKTTFLNYVLTADHGKRIGVIVNEFGKVGIDSELIVKSDKEELIELPNGCVCCTVRGDLITAAKELIATKKIEYIIVETSGMAEAAPAVIAFDEKELAKKTEIDSIICVIDAENFDVNMNRNETAKEQLEVADIVLLNKVDLVEKPAVEKIKKRIKSIVPNAQIIETVKGEANLNLILDVSKGKKVIEWKKEEHEHAHDKSITSASCITGPVDSDKIQQLFDELPETIFRAKGIVCVKESEKGLHDELRVVVQKVGKRFEMEFGTPWQKDQKKETKLVFIGTNVNQKELQKLVEKCK